MNKSKFSIIKDTWTNEYGLLNNDSKTIEFYKNNEPYDGAFYVSSRYEIVKSCPSIKHFLQFLKRNQ